jgi:hypothetical protein
MERFESQGRFDSLTQINRAGEVEMEIKDGWFRARLSTFPGRMAARMWAFAVVCEGEEHDSIAKAVLSEVGREEYRE